MLYNIKNLSAMNFNISTDFKKIISKYSGMQNILKYIEEDKKKFESVLEIFPESSNIFRCFNYFNIAETRVVIVGQDPYHTPEMAIGLCFGVPENSKKIPPSLRNIIRELREDVGVELKNKTLEEWAKQGVLLLNCALTVREKSPASHMKYWKNFTKYIIEELKKNDEIVWVAWGAFADNLIGDVKHKIISSHPSPLSYKKKYKMNPPFYGSRPFSKINEKLKREISW